MTMIIINMSVPKKIHKHEEYEWYILLQNQDYIFLNACKRTNTELKRNIRTSQNIMEYCKERNDFLEVYRQKLYLDIFEKVLKKRGSNVVS